MESPFVGACAKQHLGPGEVLPLGTGAFAGSAVQAAWSPEVCGLGCSFPAKLRPLSDEAGGADTVGERSLGP